MLLLALSLLFNFCHDRNLVRLDLSYNAIHNLSGLKKLHGPAFSLRNLYLHGNQLTSLDHVISCLIGCRKLKELTLSQYGEANPVCEISAYRSSILAALKTLEVLDGLDRTGNPAATRDNVFMGINACYFSSPFYILKITKFLFLMNLLFLWSIKRM